MTDFIWFTRRWWTCMWEWYYALLFEFSWRCRLAFQWRVTAFVKNVFLIMCVLSMYISEVHFEICVFLICLMHTSCCGRQDCLILSSVIFPPFVVLSLLLLLRSSSLLSLSSSPATRQWRSGCQRCGGRGEKQSDCVSSVSHLAATAAASSDTMWRLSRSFQGNQGVDHAEKQRTGKSKNMPFRIFVFFFFYFTANFQSAILLWCYLEINVVSLVKHPPSKQFLTWHENNHLQPGTKWKCPSVLSPRFQAVRDESAHVSAGLQY